MQSEPIPEKGSLEGRSLSQIEEMPRHTLFLATTRAGKSVVFSCLLQPDDVLIHSDGSRRLQLPQNVQAIPFNVTYSRL